MRSRGLIAALGAAMLLFPAAASAQEPDKVTGLTAAQDVGFTTLKWNPVAGATELPDRARAGRHAGRDGRHDRRRLAAAAPRSRRTKPAFADSGYKLGDSLPSGACAPASARGDGAGSSRTRTPVTGATLGHPGPA